MKNKDTWQQKTSLNLTFHHLLAGWLWENYLNTLNTIFSNVHNANNSFHCIKFQSSSTLSWESKRSNIQVTTPFLFQVEMEFLVSSYQYNIASSLSKPRHLGKPDFCLLWRLIQCHRKCHCISMLRVLSHPICWSIPFWFLVASSINTIKKVMQLCINDHLHNEIKS